MRKSLKVGGKLLKKSEYDVSMKYHNIFDLEKCNLHLNWSEFEKNFNDLVKYNDLSKMAPPLVHWI